MMLVIACAEALFASPARTGATLTRAETGRLITDAVRARGGVRGCAAEMANSYGDSPETAMARMRWALQVVRDAYRTRSPGEQGR